MTLKLITSRNKKTKNLYIRGSYLGTAVDKSCGTDKRAVARAILKQLEKEIELGVYQKQKAVMPPRPSFVYFIGCGDYIKIGYAASIKMRLSSISTSNPYPLKVLAAVAGGIEVERGLHNRFADSLHRGEWFRKTPELMAFIAQLSTDREAA